MREGGGNSLKYLKRGWSRKEEWENKDFKKRGQAGSRVKKGGGLGALKKEGGGWNPLANYVLSENTLNLSFIRVIKKLIFDQSFVNNLFKPMHTLCCMLRMSPR